MLSARRASIVSTVGLARLAGRIDLGSSLFLGEGEAQRGGRRRPSILASAFEALAGALYLDLGFDLTRDWLRRRSPRPRSASTRRCSSLKSPKSRLQEYTQRRTGVAARVPRRRRDRPGPREAVPGRGPRRRPAARRRRRAVAPDRRDRRRPAGDGDAPARDRRAGGRPSPAPTRGGRRRRSRHADRGSRPGSPDDARRPASSPSGSRASSRSPSGRSSSSVPGSARSSGRTAPARATSPTRCAGRSASRAGRSAAASRRT